MMITAIGSGNMPQINNIALVMNTEFSVPKLFTGLFLGVLLWIIIIGGILHIRTDLSAPISILALIAVLVATINIAGGFYITHRMLKMFRR